MPTTPAIDPRLAHLPADPRNDDAAQAQERQAILAEIEEERRRQNRRTLHPAPAVTQHDSPPKFAWKTLGVVFFMTTVLIALAMILVNQRSVPDDTAARVVPAVKAEMTSVIQDDGKLSRDQTDAHAKKISDQADAHAKKVNENIVATGAAVVTKVGEAADARAAAYETQMQGLVASLALTATAANDAKSAAAETQKKVSELLTAKRPPADPASKGKKSGRSTQPTTTISMAQLDTVLLMQKRVAEALAPAPAPSPSTTPATVNGSTVQPSSVGGIRSGAIDPEGEVIESLGINQVSRKYSVDETSRAEVYPEEIPGVIVRCYQGIGTGAPVDVEIPITGNYKLPRNTRQVQFLNKTQPMHVLRKK